MLFCFATGFAFGADNKVQKLLPKNWRRKMARRTVAGVPSKRLYTLPGLELKALWQIRRGAKPEKAIYERNRRFQEAIPQHLIDAATVVVGFDTSSWILIERCRKANKPFVLDASIAHPLSQQSVFEQIRKKYPAWSGQLPKKAPALIELEETEMETASHIVVASEFTRSTYLEHGIQGNRISINHYGIDPAFFVSKWSQPNASNAVATGTIRFLFFSKISARKGFPWLCDIWESFHRQYPNTQLIAAGYDSPPKGFQLPAGIELTGFVHPADRLALFHGSDVFVFPSFFEGFAQVIIEAMACGLPVITTTHTIGPEVITDGQEGFCMKPWDNDALYRALEHFVLNREAIPSMGKAARNRVESITWDNYGNRWKTIIESVLQTRQPVQLTVEDD